jgi:hypothetical protein
MNTLYRGKLEYADPLYGILSPKVCPDVKDPIFHVNSMSNRSVYKYTEEETSIATMSVPKRQGWNLSFLGLNSSLIMIFNPIDILMIIPNS